MVIFRVGHASACVLAFLAVVIAQGCVTAQAVPIVAPKVVIELSPASVNAGSKTTLAVTVSNPGNSSSTYSQLNITTIIPTYWECESDVEGDCSIHSTINLMKGQSSLTEYRILIPSNASQGDYFIHVRVSWNQTYSAIYSGRVSVTAPTVGPKVTIELSPSTVNAGVNTTLAVTISNPGNSTFIYSQLNITETIPSSWTIYSTVEQAHNLTKGQSTLAQYQIFVPSNASQGDYFIHVRVSWNQTYSAIYSGRVSVQFVLGPSLPGEIPFVLAVMILPGFIAFALGVYLSGAKLSDCSVLQVVLVSILLGAFIWETGGLNIILATSNANVLLSTLMNSNRFQPVSSNWALNVWQQNIWVRTLLIAIAIAITARFGAFASWVFRQFALGAMSWEWFRGLWYQRVEGYDKVQITNTAWETQLRLSRRHHRQGYRTKITLTLGDKASATSDQSKTLGQTKTPLDQSKPSEETKTPDQPTPSDQAKTLSGLFVAGDVKDPLNLILDPQYIVEAEDLVSLQRLLASKLSLRVRSFLHSRFHFGVGDGIKGKDLWQLNDSLDKDGSLIENALVKARHGIKCKDKGKQKHKCIYKISAANNGDFVKGRTLIREQVLRWEISPEPEHIARFKIRGDPNMIPTEDNASKIPRPSHL